MTFIIETKTEKLPKKFNSKKEALEFCKKSKIKKFKLRKLEKICVKK